MRVYGLILLVWLGTFPAFCGPGKSIVSTSSRSLRESPVSRLTNIAECLDEVRSDNRRERPLRLEATVTYVDEERSLVVLQDSSAAIGVYLPSNHVVLEPGERVLVEGRGVAPFVQSFPDYPDQPAGRSFLTSFEAPSCLGTYYLARVRGYLHPPVTGTYTFWIASDDAGEFFLSTDASPEDRREIASNAIRNSTRVREWDRYPSQKSEPITLKAGATYYVEALHIQNYGSNSMAVAWKGPGIERSVIDGQFLTPWIDLSDENNPALPEPIPTNGLLREQWNHFFVSDFAALQRPNPNESFVRIHSLKLTEIADEEMAAAVKIAERANLDSIPDLSRVETEGEVTFAAGTRGGGQLELKRGDTELSVSVASWSGFPIERLINSRVRTRGVLVHGYGPDGRTTNSLMWVSDSQQIESLPSERNPSQNLDEVPICDLQPSNPAMSWGKPVRVRGRLVQRNTNGMITLEGNDNYQGFYSTDGTNWISLGSPVEIGISNSVLAGLAVASADSSNLASASFDCVQGMGTNWSGTDIGSPQLPGNISVSNGVVTVKGSGDAIGSNKDTQFYAWQQMENETEASVRLVDLQRVNSHTQVGIMFRESVNRRSPYAAVLFTTIGGVVFQYRRVIGDYSVAAQPEPMYRNFCWMKLARQKSFLFVRGNPGPEIRDGQELEVAGIVTWQNSTPVIDDASFAVARENMDSPQSTINQTQQAIPIADFAAEAGHPPQTYLSRNLRGLDLRGVVTFCDVVLGKPFLFVQGGNEGGIQVVWPDTNLTPGLQVGQSVEMNGVSPVRQFPVTFGPLMLKVTGWGTLPQPVPYSPALLSTDSAQARWVEATGIVHSVDTNGLISLMTSDGPLQAWVGQSHGSSHHQYVDNAVRMRGVLSFDTKRSVRLLVPAPDFVEVLESSPADPFSIPRFAIAQISNLEMKPERLRRMKLGGVVTCSLPQGVYVQDETGGAFVRTGEANLLRPGDRIEAVGFPNIVSTGLTLEGAEIRKTGVADLPEPIEADSSDIDGTRHTAELVAVTATLVDQHKSEDGDLLVLQNGTKILQATLPGENDGRLQNISIGSLVKVTGVCQFWQQYSQTTLPLTDASVSSASINLLLRSPADVVILKRPPWWTLKSVAWATGLLVFGLLGALIRVRILRKRVALRSRELQSTMRQLEKETRASALLAERDRLAGEIHDSLEQGLTAIMMQLDAAEKHLEKSPEARAILHRARNMAEFSRAEIQHAVWNILSPLLEDADLATAIKHVAGQISSGSPEVKIEIKGTPRPLPSSLEHHLLRMAQEAITNATKHAKAKTILVKLDYTGPGLELIVEDDGVGFVPGAVAPGSKAGGFGLQGLRARAKKLNANLDIASQAGNGTVITVKMKTDSGDLHSAGAE
jgi:signal transduction histidine kinase